MKIALDTVVFNHSVFTGTGTQSSFTVTPRIGLPAKAKSITLDTDSQTVEVNTAHRPDGTGGKILTVPLSNVTVMHPLDVPATPKK